MAIPDETTAGLRNYSMAAESRQILTNDVMADAISRKLEEDIVFGRLLPGRKLPEEDLANRFGVSRHHVREALARLITNGIAVKQRHRGVYVRSFSAAEVAEIYEVREILQRQAALRIPLPASGSNIDRLQAIHEAHEDAVATGDLQSIRRT